MAKIENEIEPLTRALKAQFIEMQHEREEAFGGAITRFNNVLVRSLQGMVAALSGLCEEGNTNNGSGGHALTGSGRAGGSNGSGHDLMTEQGVFRLKNITCLD